MAQVLDANFLEIIRQHELNAELEQERIQEQAAQQIQEKEQKQKKRIRSNTKKRQALGKNRPGEYAAGTYSDKFMNIKNLAGIVAVSDIKDPFIEYLYEESKKVDNCPGIAGEISEHWYNNMLTIFNKPFIPDSMAVREAYEKLAKEEGCIKRPGENYYAVPYEKFVSMFNMIWGSFQI